MRVGLVEDNEDFRAEVAFHLRRAGFEIALESDGADIDAQFAQSPCDLLVLDLGLPAEDGLLIAQRLRRLHPRLGIVMLTARGALDDRLAGLQQGADAYLTKPTDMRELVAVMLSVQRRLEAGGEPAPAERFWRLQPVTMTLVTPDGKTINLTANEIWLLKQLGETGADPVSRKALAEAIGQATPNFDDRRLEVAFSRLRQKMAAVAPGEDVIKAARGRGYLFAARLIIDG